MIFLVWEAAHRLYAEKFAVGLELGGIIRHPMSQLIAIKSCMTVRAEAIFTAELLAAHHHSLTTETLALAVLFSSEP